MSFPWASLPFRRLGISLLAHAGLALSVVEVRGDCLRSFAFIVAGFRKDLEEAPSQAVLPARYRIVCGLSSVTILVIKKTGSASLSLRPLGSVGFGLGSQWKLLQEE